MAPAEYCIAADPFDSGIRPNPEGVKLLEAEDNHIDESEFRISSRLEKNSFY